MTETYHQIDFEPLGRRAKATHGQNILEVARNEGIEIVSLCGGAGTCNACRVRIMSGKLNPPTSVEKDDIRAEELAAGYRLACQAEPQSDIKVHIPPESLTTSQKLQLEGQEIDIVQDKAIKFHHITLTPPTLTDAEADLSRLKRALENQGITNIRFSLHILQTLSDQIRQNNWNVVLAIRSDELVAVLPPLQKTAGLAVDIGTTKVAAYLLDYETGEVLARQGAMNPQISYGEDVISRISYANEHPLGGRILQQKIIDTLNDLIEELCNQAKIQKEHILEAVVVGNTVIQHLFAGLSVKQLGIIPYTPTVSEEIFFSARNIGLNIAPGGYIYIPPNIAGYVGADHVAAVLATEIYKTQKTSIMLDIGTNTEVSLAYKGEIYCCSCASGPAFEGAHIREGMRAAAGAIERVMINSNEILTYAIDNQPPIGICGSGILDVIAQMYKAGITDSRGALKISSPFVKGEGKDRHLLLIPAEKSGHGRDITISRSDVNEIQLAKAAIRAGIDILLENAGITADQIEQFIIAGAFGTYLDVRSAVQIGMFPYLPLECFSQVGNAAGTGSRLMLMSSEKRKIASDFAHRMHYVELTLNPDFQNIFLKAMYFPPIT